MLMKAWNGANEIHVVGSLPPSPSNWLVLMELFEPALHERAVLHWRKLDGLFQPFDR